MSNQSRNTKTRTRHLALAAVITATLAACGPSGGGPALSPVPDQIGAVGQELVVAFTATDPDRDELVYSFSAELAGIHDRAAVSQLLNGAEFRWTPQAEDVGVHFIDLIVSDGGQTDTVTVQFDIRSAIGSSSNPKFIRPDGSGKHHDLDAEECVEIDIVIVDADSSSVTIEQAEPRLKNATLRETGPLEAIWRWCPSQEQIDAELRHMVVFTADDGENPPTVNPYLIVLSKQQKENCPGAPPAIGHTAADVSTVTGLTIDATIIDAEGLKQEPLLYYSETAPADPPVLGDMTQVTMLLVDGDMRNGTWAADVPNPVVGEAVGSTQDLHYVIVATDDDDTSGDCDHTTLAPQTGAFTMTVTNPGGDGGAPECAPCTADVQCGSSGDLCVRVGNGSDAFCLSSCSSDSQCPESYSCSPDPVESVDGAMARQCVPDSNDCSNPSGTTCTDDDFENNDSLDEAIFDNPPLLPGTESLVSCPSHTGVGDDEDWFDLEITEEGTLDFSISGTSASDLDLSLYDGNGVLLESSVSFTSNEQITLCAEPGFYTIRVHAYSPEENPYTLTYAFTPGSCGATCEADENEEDDSAAAARAVSIAGGHTSTTQTICPGDPDFYEVFLFTGETIVADLVFSQDGINKDLDIHLHDSGGDLTPCSPADVSSCDTQNGQSGTDDEHFEFTVDADGLYYIEVRGFDVDDENFYDITLGLQ